MTALTQYDRLEATGLWRATPEDQRREVILSLGDATLTISDLNDRPLTHWSLAAVERQNPGERPAIYCPDEDTGQTLELGDGEDQMTDAIEKLRRAIDRSRPHPGRLRIYIILAILAAVLTGLIFWLPGAMRRHAVSVVPDIKRQEIGTAVLDRIERVAGRICTSPEAIPVLARLARRANVRRVVVLSGDHPLSLHLPGGVILLSHSIISANEDPAVAAGYVLAEAQRAATDDPLDRLLKDGGIAASFHLLTTGEVTKDAIDHHAEALAARPPAPIADETLLSAFKTAEVPSTPYAFALDPSGEAVLGLIEADPMSGQSPPPVLRDRDWIVLQGICR